ncbi:hypothetical protein PMIN06_012890 [Paraphaeosphaeria minitans]
MEDHCCRARQQICSCCKNFVWMILEQSAPPEIVERLVNISVGAALATALQEYKQELGKILADQARFPVTYNHYFTTTLQKQRQRKHEKHAGRATQASRIERHHVNETSHGGFHRARHGQIRLRRSLGQAKSLL